MFDGEWTGQRRWKKHTRGNDERKWCAWWVLNGWPVGQSPSDCLLKGWETQRDGCRGAKKHRARAWESRKEGMIRGENLLQRDSEVSTCLVLHQQLKWTRWHEAFTVREDRTEASFIHLWLLQFQLHFCSSFSAAQKCLGLQTFSLQSKFSHRNTSSDDPVLTLLSYAEAQIYFSQRSIKYLI